MLRLTSESGHRFSYGNDNDNDNHNDNHNHNHNHNRNHNRVTPGRKGAGAQRARCARVSRVRVGECVKTLQELHSRE